MLLLNILLSGLVSTTAAPHANAPKLVGESSYVSAEANEYNIRSRIDVRGSHFTMRAIGADPRTGAGSHDGGIIRIDEEDSFYRLQNIGIYLPKPGVAQWTADDLQCQRLGVNDDVYSSVCIEGQRRFSYLVSKSRGVLAFTGFCRITEGRLCEYVLVSKTGIASQQP